MHRHQAWAATALLAAGLCLAGCGVTSADSAPDSHDSPAQVVPISGTDRSKVVLTSSAASRLGIASQAVATLPGTPPLLAVPASALIYDKNGSTWVYTTTQTLTYQREPITVVRVDGDRAVLSSGPVVGTSVVTVGAAELLGTEYGVAGQ
jgi:hypothetical protein